MPTPAPAGTCRATWIVAVSNPVSWCALESAEDLALFRKSLDGRDYLMYRTILSELDHLRSGRKGIFLTNTRHAYTGIRDLEGRLHWNTGTFFRQWHPGRTLSIRIHNVTLSIEQARAPDAQGSATTAGMERFDYHWVRMARGLWDSAFAARCNEPVGFEIAGTPFGAEPYVGNHMMDAAPGQTMSDTYDAVIFLGPLEDLHTTARFRLVSSAGDRQELARRYHVLYTEDELKTLLHDRGLKTLDELIGQDTAPAPVGHVLDELPVGPVDAWRGSLRAPGQE